MLKDYLEGLLPNERGFIQRCYGEGLEKYSKRLKKIALEGGDTKVLDCGCGYGQWSLALAKQNKFVYGIDIQERRIQIAQKFSKEFGVDNVSFQVANAENLPFGDNTFDFVFCYSVIYMMDWKRALREIFRVLRGGGVIYLCSNDKGWYYNLIINEPNKTPDYNPRELGINAFINEYRYAQNEHFAGDRVMPLERVLEFLQTCGAEILAFGGEGCCIYEKGRYSVDKSLKGFFLGEYFGECGVYEILAKKR
ncbi:class I SAM-dependent methyltransferase [Helicobacter mesocricetorum]|uniref:class I SAM-dependent methyltransferase n=1 Tax=Helicobacter mesocricetorum TaxID=87012 RepID=UPI000CF04776|nr:class I SAM-dependent methyltransferase [Helicobacter mesocricetorum]